VIDDAEYSCREKKNKNESEIHINGAVYSRQDLDSKPSRRRVASHSAPKRLYISRYYLLLKMKRLAWLKAISKKGKERERRVNEGKIRHQIRLGRSRKSAELTLWFLDFLLFFLNSVISALLFYELWSGLRRILKELTWPSPLDTGLHIFTYIRTLSFILFDCIEILLSHI